MNNLTFGETSYLFNSLTNDLQEKIARDFSVKFKREYNTKNDVSVGALKQIIKAVNFYRNICAHEEVLYSKKIGALKEKNFKKYYDNSVLNEIKKGSLFGLLAMLKLVLSLEDLNQLLLSIYFPLVINDKLGIFETISITTIKLKMGFIEGWEYKISNFIEMNSGLLKIFEDKEEFK
ncbi:Abi family protein [Enterococcus sp. AZ172]|uniref:Abi family protein n=1 Tax=unclassified Enterococcus TaxID=2608891 RepID=UPI003F688A38